MRAARVTELGRPPEIGEAPDPARGEGEALIRVLAAPLNPIEINVGAGRFYGGHPPLPFIPGGEAVGRVVEAETLAPDTLVWANGAGMGTRRDGGDLPRAWVRWRDASWPAPNPAPCVDAHSPSHEVPTMRATSIAPAVAA